MTKEQAPSVVCPARRVPRLRLVMRLARRRVLLGPLSHTYGMFLLYSKLAVACGQVALHNPGTSGGPGALPSGSVEEMLRRPPVVTNLVVRCYRGADAMPRSVLRAAWQEDGFHATVQMYPSGASNKERSVVIQAGFQSLRYWFQTNRLVYIWDNAGLTPIKGTNHVYSRMEAAVLPDIESILSMGIPDVEPGLTEVQSDRVVCATKSGEVWHGTIARDERGRVGHLDLFYDAKWKQKAYEILYSYRASSGLDFALGEIERRKVDSRAQWEAVRYEIDRFELSSAPMHKRAFDYRALVPQGVQVIYTGRDPTVISDAEVRQTGSTVAERPSAALALRLAFAASIGVWTAVSIFVYHRVEKVTA